MCSLLELTALANKCYMCANTPGFPAEKRCDSENVESVTCNPGLNKCMTITGTMTIPGGGSTNFQLKNCSNTILCNPDSPFASK